MNGVNRILNHQQQPVEEQLLQSPGLENDAIKESSQTKTIRPYLIVATGTTGVKVADGIKRMCRHGNEQSVFKILAFDTDQGARNGTILDDNEFQLIRLDRIRNALENPDKHQKIYDRLDLNHPSTQANLEKFIADALQQASAVRSNGCHGLLAEYRHIENVLQEALQEINDLSRSLDRQLGVGNSTHIREDLKTFVISSVCGGSGSSANLQLIASLKQFTSAMNVDIVPYFIMPSAFEDTLKNLPEHWMRTKANGYAALKEFAAFAEGIGTRHQIDLAADDQVSLYLAAGFARNAIIAGNKNCRGKHLSMPVIISTLVEFISTIICKPSVADVLETFDQNAATLNVTEDDRKGRYVASAGAASLCLDTDRIARYGAATATLALLRGQALGNGADRTREKVESWLTAPKEGIPSLKDNGFAESIRRSVPVTFEAKARNLYHTKNGNHIKRLNDGSFALAASALREQISKEWLPRAREVVSKARSTLQAQLVSSFSNEVAILAAQSGLVAEDAYVETLEKRLQEIRENYLKKLESLRRNISQLDSTINERIDKLNANWLRGWTKSKLEQDKIYNLMKSLYEVEVDSIAHDACCDLLQQLATQCALRREEIQKALTSSEDLIHDLQETQRASAAGHRSHTERSHVEIDIGSREMDRLLFKRFCPDLRNISAKIPLGERQKWFQQLCSKGQLSNKVRSEFEEFFSKKISSLSLPELMCEVLENEESAGEFRTKLLHVVQETQPAWGEADSKNNATMFSDHLVIGIPEGPANKRQIIEDEVRRAANGRVNVNAQYNAALQIVTVPGNKLTVIRLVQGAAWHYLPEVRNLEAAYNKWYQDGGHTVHIFNRATVAKMPSLIPAKRLLDEEHAIAVGLAYGAIARRGQQYYWNLRKENQTYCFPLKSHWDTIATEPNSSLSRLAKDGKYITFSGEECLEESLKIGTSLASLQAYLKTNAAHRKLMLEFFSSLREQSGDSVIASELDEFVSKLLSRDSKLNTTSADAHSLTTLVGRVIDMLRLVK
jgi:hypothetical protein